MLTDDTCISGEDLGTLSSTPPPPAAKRMRLSITRVEVIRKGKRQAFILPPMAKRFRFGDTSSSSTDMQGLFYASSPDRFSTNLLNKNSSSSSSSILLPLILPLQAGVPSPSAVPLPSSSRRTLQLLSHRLPPRLHRPLCGIIAPPLPIPHLGVHLLAHQHLIRLGHLVPSLPPKFPYPAVPTEIRQPMSLFPTLTARDYNASLFCSLY